MSILNILKQNSLFHSFCKEQRYFNYFSKIYANQNPLCESGIIISFKIANNYYL